MDILTFGTDRRTEACRRFLLDSGGEIGRFARRILLFPIPFSRDGVNVTGTDLPVSDALSEVRNGDLAVGYAFPPETKKVLADRDVLLCDAKLDPVFEEENARLTALGTLGVLLASSPSVGKDLRVGVIGFGRIGEQLCRFLLFLGFDVTVFSARQSVREAVGRYGMKTRQAFYGSASTDFSGLDVLINTAPADTLFPENAPDGLRVLDLASGRHVPGSVPHERLPGIPAERFPESAGFAYAGSVLRMLSIPEERRFPIS